MIGRNPRLLSAGATPASVYADLWAHLTSGRPWRGEFVNRRKGGGEYNESAIISPLHDEQGRITHYLAVQEDVTERRRDEERIRKLINFDALTGLPNRTMFASRFSQALALTQRSGHQLARLYLDLDHFKNVYDSLGHQVGDGLLIEISHRLQSVVRDEDAVSRQGGDEFVIVLPLTDAQQAAHVADELQAQVRRICKLEHHELVVTSSIGIAMYPEDGGTLRPWRSVPTRPCSVPRSPGVTPTGSSRRTCRPGRSGCCRSRMPCAVLWCWASGHCATSHKSG